MDLNEFDERFEHHESILRRLTAMLVEQRQFNLHISGLLQEQREFNQDVKTTLARIETLIARMLPTGENGRDA
jgi:hypothetical protein